MAKSVVTSEHKEMNLDAISALTSVELAYMAGFFDGEGSIGVYKKTIGRFTPVVSLTQREPGVLEAFHNTFGGTLRLREGQDKTCNRFAFYELKFTKFDTCAVLLKRLMPYLRVKKEQAEIFLTFMPNREDRQHGANVVQLLAEAKKGHHG